MIFDENFDNSLWCIFVSDKLHRQKIIELIKSIPTELYEQINEALEKYKTIVKIEKSSEEFLFEGQVNLENGERYNFYLDDDMLNLAISKSIKNGDHYDDVFELSLFDIGNLDKLENFNEEWIGVITDNITETHCGKGCSLVDCEESEYNLIKTPVTFITYYRQENLETDKTKLIIKFINMKKKPNDLTIKDLENYDSPKRLSLKPKKK